MKLNVLLFIAALIVVSQLPASFWVQIVLAGAVGLLSLAMKHKG